jgi:hypothetical protein
MNPVFVNLLAQEALTIISSFLMSRPVPKPGCKSFLQNTLYVEDETRHHFPNEYSMFLVMRSYVSMNPDQEKSQIIVH